MLLTFDKKESVDTLPAELRALVVEKDGKWVLDIESADEVKGLKSALNTERASNKTIKEKVAAWEKLGKSADEIEAMLAAERKKAEEAELKAGNFDGVLKTHLDKAKQEREAAERKLAGERDSAINLARKAIVDTRLTGALTKGKVSAEGASLLPRILADRVKVEFGNDGRETITILDADGGDMVGTGKNGVATFDDLVKEATTSFPSLFEGTGAGGGGSRQNNGRGGKTITRREFDQMNPVEQHTKVVVEKFQIVD